MNCIRLLHLSMNNFCGTIADNKNTFYIFERF